MGYLLVVDDLVTDVKIWGYKLPVAFSLTKRKTICDVNKVRNFFSNHGRSSMHLCSLKVEYYQIVPLTQ